MIQRWSWTRPRSLAVRLVAGAALWSAIALIVTGILLATLFRDVAQRNFDNRLRVLLEGLIAVAEVNGDEVQLTNVPGEPRFNQPYSGWSPGLFGYPPHARVSPCHVSRHSASACHSSRALL